MYWNVFFYCKQTAGHNDVWHNKKRKYICGGQDK